MKKILFITLLIFNASFAQDPFEVGNQFYQKNNYKEAITSYESILNSGKESSELYFNLGNCYYKLNLTAPAIYNYEKALKLNPNDEEIQNNLEFAQKNIKNPIKNISKVGFNKFIEDFTSTFCYDTWAWISVVLSFLLLISFIGYYFSNNTFRKRIFFALMFAFFVIVLISIISSIFEKNRLSNENSAIVFEPNSYILSEPKAQSQTIRSIPEGSKVYILETIANWKKVQLTDETIGWISDESIKKL